MVAAAAMITSTILTNIGDASATVDLGCIDPDKKDIEIPGKGILGSEEVCVSDRVPFDKVPPNQDDEEDNE